MHLSTFHPWSGMSKWGIILVLFLASLFWLHACNQKTYVFKNIGQEVELVSKLNTKNGVRLTLRENGHDYNLDLEKIDRTYSVMVTNERGKIELLAISDDDNGKRSPNFFALFEESESANRALGLVNREFVRGLVSDNLEADSTFNSETFLRMLPSERSSGSIVVIPDEGDAIIVKMDNGVGVSGDPCRGPDSISNACKAAAKQYHLCKATPNKDCSDLKAEMDLRCDLIDPGVGNFTM